MTPLAPGGAYNPFDNALLGAGLIAYALASLIELAFLIHYLRVAPAFKSWIGLMFVLRSVSSLLAGVAILLSRIFGPFYTGRPLITLILFVIVLFSSGVTYGTFLYERYGRTRCGPFRGMQNFARRALGLKARPTEEPCPEVAEQPRLIVVRDENA